jgi:DNA helicase-2/ATP-dependent DNA helicase PcrA
MLTDQQKAAAETTAERVAVIAGAGSGKTRVLTARLMFLIQSGVPARRILAVTFTRKAAGEMRERVERVGHLTESPEISTFHAWCARQLRKNAASVFRDEDFSIYDDVDRLDLLRLCGTELGVPGADRARADTLAKHPDVRALYEERLREGNAFDYDALEEAMLDLCTMHQTRGDYTHVLVDEAQDLSPMQWAILRALAPQHLYLVGDPRQSIYHFRGASPELLTAWCDRDDVTTVYLTHNFRSRPEIVHVANDVAPQRWLPMETPQQPDTIGIEAFDLPARRVEFHAVDSEPVAVVRRLTEHNLEGMAWGDMAVLGRTWRELREVQKAARVAHVPTSYYGKRWDPWETPDGRALARALALALNPADDNLAALVAAWGGGAATSGPRLLGLRAEAARQRSTLFTQLWHASPGWRDVRYMLAEAYRQRPDPEVRDMTLVDARATALAYLAGLQRPQDRAVDLILDDLEHMPLTRWRDWWQFGRTEQDQIKPGVDAVHLMTVHAAKGLEWPVVVVLGADDHTYPRSADPDEAAEDRRVLYVAVTRARERLILTRSSTVGWSRYLRTLIG